VRAAAALAGQQNLPLDEAQKKRVEAANEEYLASLLSRPDQWGSHYNLGNYYLNRGDFRQAVASYDTALKREPRAVLAMVNESIAYARLGENQRANDALQKALKVAPDNAAVKFNMGLLMAEQNDLKQAETHLRAALKADPQMAQAAYNLCIITAKNRLEEAIGFCRKASVLRPDDPRYAYTLAFYLNQGGHGDEALSILKAIVDKHPAYRDAQQLLQRISKTKEATP
jgi:tetratricopeptide (TPR) repeat protein